MSYDTESRNLQINSRLQPITDKIPEDPRTAQVVKQWAVFSDKVFARKQQHVKRAYQGFRASGFIPEQAIATTNVALDGLETSVRNKSTNLTALIAEAMLTEAKKADLAIFNAGSIRIDDYIPLGQITQYDIIRILPFGGKVLVVEMNGSLLKRVLDQGQANRGKGGYLQTANVSIKPDIGTWLIQRQPLEMNRNYRVAINDFLITGKEKGLEFLNLEETGVKLIDKKRDIRFAIIDQLKASNTESALRKY